MEKVSTYSAQFKFLQPVQKHTNEIENKKIIRMVFRKKYIKTKPRIYKQHIR